MTLKHLPLLMTLIPNPKGGGLLLFQETVSQFHGMYNHKTVRKINNQEKQYCNWRFLSWLPVPE